MAHARNVIGTTWLVLLAVAIFAAAGFGIYTVVKPGPETCTVMNGSGDVSESTDC